MPLAMDAGAGVAGDERRAAHPPVPELRAAAAALVRMAAAAAPEGFRTAVAALGSESRSRLQSALASSSPGGVATTPGGWLRRGRRRRYLSDRWVSERRTPSGCDCGAGKIKSRVKGYE